MASLPNGQCTLWIGVLGRGDRLPERPRVSSTIGSLDVDTLIHPGRQGAIAPGLVASAVLDATRGCGARLPASH
jgi:hypothetical protein